VSSSPEDYAAALLAAHQHALEVCIILEQSRGVLHENLQLVEPPPPHTHTRVNSGAVFLPCVLFLYGTILVRVAS
jgi:hypothetical protein